MTEHQFRRMGTDFWGAPPAPPEREAPPEGPAAEEPEETAASAGEEASSAPEPEKIEDILAELDGYIGLTEVKKEVRDLISLVKVHQLRRENGLPVEGTVFAHGVLRQSGHGQDHRGPHHGPGVPRLGDPL